MKALTLWQPWATLVAMTVKRFETRSWGTSYRGPLAVHAARKADEDVEEYCRQATEDLKKCWGLQFLREELKRAGEVPLSQTLGRIVAVCRLVDCRPMREAPNGQEALFGTFGPGRWGWELDDVEPVLVPVPCRGKQGLWDVPPEVALALPPLSPYRARKSAPEQPDLFGG